MQMAHKTTTFLDSALQYHDLEMFSSLQSAEYLQSQYINPTSIENHCTQTIAPTKINRSYKNACSYCVQ